MPVGGRRRASAPTASPLSTGSMVVARHPRAVGKGAETLDARPLPGGPLHQARCPGRGQRPRGGTTQRSLHERPTNGSGSRPGAVSGTRPEPGPWSMCCCCTAACRRGPSWPGIEGPSTADSVDPAVVAVEARRSWATVVAVTVVLDQSLAVFDRPATDARPLRRPARRSG